MATPKTWWRFYKQKEDMPFGCFVVLVLCMAFSVSMIAWICWLVYISFKIN